MGLRPFVIYFVAQFRTAFLIRMGLVAIGSVADAMMPIFVGLVVGLLATTNPGEMFTEHWPTLLVMVGVVAIVRPLTFLFDTLIRNHAIVPNLVDLVRWQSHWHVIRQSWTFFQNDFAGRIANKVMQVGEAIETGGQPRHRCGLVRAGLRRRRDHRAGAARLGAAGADRRSGWCSTASCSPSPCRSSPAIPRICRRRNR